MNKVLTRGIITIAAVNDGKDGHSLTAKAFIEGSYRNGRTKGVKSYVKVFYDGQEVKDFTVSYRYKGAGQADWVKPQTNKEDSWSDAQRDGSTLFVEYTVEYKGLKAVATGRLDNIQDGKDGLDAVVFRLIPKIEKAVVHGTKRKKAKVVLFLKYMITRQEGEKHYSELGRLDTFGLSLTIEPSWASFEVKWEDGKPYWVIKTTYKYANCFDNTPFFRVCLMQGGKVLDARTIGLQYEVESNFNVGKRVEGIDGKIDGISGTVKTLDGKVSGFEATIDHFSTEVKDKVSHSELKQTADGIEMKVGSSVNANLLWGSDLDLSAVQDKIQLACEQGANIKQKTAKKEDLQRQLDATPTNDTAKRNDLQKKINACNDDINTAKNKISECREYIGKHLGVVISGDMEIENKEMFQYLKGEGVGGSDAIRFKNAYKREDWAQWTNISWHDVQLKPNTKYTISVWVKFKSYGKKGRMYVDCISDDGRYCFGGFLYKEHYYSRESIDEWQRVRYVFNSGTSKKMSALNFCCIADEEEGAQCEIWLCRPKLEEGNTATPWCAYDGTMDALLAGGFDIKNRKFSATADNFVVQNNKGEQTFFVDENGRINNGLLVSKLRLTEPTIITNKNYQEFCYKGKINGHDVLFLDLLKCGTLLVLNGVGEQLYLDLPSFKYFEGFNDNTLEENAKAQYDKMRYIGNTIILYNINSESVFVSGVLKYKRMAGVKDMNYLDEFGFYTDERLLCRASELASFECKFGITRPEGNAQWYNRQAGVFWEFCYVTIT
nr:MAG TPA: Minor structural protein 4, Minor, Lactococcus lactis, Siphoviridae, nanobody [Caudoviricetes sp.]